MLMKDLVDFLCKCKLSKRNNELAINLYFLCNGLKPSILWDFGSTNGKKLSCLKNILGQDLIILDVAGNFIICYKSSIASTLNNYFSNPPLVIDVSQMKRSSTLAELHILGSIELIVNSVLKQLSTNNELLINLEVEESWNLSTLFGVLLGFPVVYYFDPSHDNCLSNTDLTLWQVGGRWRSLTAWPVSFTAPADLGSVVEARVDKWWELVGGGIKWGEEQEMGDVRILSNKKIVNMPSVVM